MRVRANQSPPGAFHIEDQPDQPGHVCVKFYENAQEVTKYDQDTGEQFKFWEYDEYPLIVPASPELTGDIETNYNEWLLTAKSHSPEAIAAAEIQDLRQAIEILADGVDLQTVNMESYTAFALGFKATR